MIIIGIDPGTASTGYGVVQKRGPKIFKCVEYGLIKTEPTMTAANRLKKLNNDLSKIIAKHKPEVLVIERLYFFKNLKTVIPVSQAGGVILLCAAKKKIPVHQYTPLQVKMAVAGHGWAEKKLVQQRIKKIFKLKEIPKPDDAADALAIAMTHFIIGKA